MRKPKIPLFRTYVRAGDLIIRKNGIGEPTRVHLINDGAAIVGNQHHPISFCNLDALWRLYLCDETVAKGDVLLWNQERRINVISVFGKQFFTKCPRRDDGIHRYEWGETNHWAVMLRRSKPKPLPDCPPSTPFDVTCSDAGPSPIPDFEETQP